MIEINITINEQFHTLQELANTLRALYSHIEYQSFSCYRIQFTPDVLIERFITVINGDKFYVSGTITV